MYCMTSILIKLICTIQNSSNQTHLSNLVSFDQCNNIIISSDRISICVYLLYLYLWKRYLIYPTSPLERARYLLYLPLQERDVLCITHREVSSISLRDIFYTSLLDRHILCISLLEKAISCICRSEREIFYTSPFERDISYASLSQRDPLYHFLGEMFCVFLSKR